MTKTLDDQYYSNTPTSQEHDIFVTADTVGDVSEARRTINYSNDDDNDYVKPSHSTTRPSTTTTTTTVTHIPPPIQKPNLAEMKRHRVRSQCLMGWVGGAVGCLLLFIPGAIIGAIAGNKITKHVMKKEEQQAQEDYEFRLSQIRAMQMSNTNS